ncbi:MAG: hypothetical protein AAGA16_25770 [Cyanobacteria bacterium P01_E01_bin.35]
MPQASQLPLQTTEQNTHKELIPCLFHNSHGEAICDVYKNGTRYSYSLWSKEFEMWLKCYLYDRCSPESKKNIFKKSKINEILQELEILAESAPEAELYSDRVVRYEEKVYLNLGDGKGNAIAIDSTGWKIVRNPPVRFQISRDIEPLPMPVQGGKLAELEEITNLNQQQLVLVAGWLLGALNPNPPYPLLVITGEQGSGKSSLARMLKQLVDPSKGVLRSQPRDERNLMVAAINTWVLCFDNFSKLSQSLSDGLCRLSTGNSYVDRVLYSNNQQIVLEAARPVIITSIADIVSNGDLMDRSICLHCDRISEQQRKSEAEIQARFEQLRPKILGLLCSAVSQALANRQQVNLEIKPRMADFAEWVAAAESALGFESGTFITAYQANRQTSQRLTIQDSPVALAIQNLLLDRVSWQGTATELLNIIREFAAEHRYYGDDLPRAANKLSGQLRKINPGLRTLGIEVILNYKRLGKSGSRIIKIVRIAS